MQESLIVFETMNDIILCEYIDHSNIFRVEIVFCILSERLLKTLFNKFLGEVLVVHGMVVVLVQC